MDEMTGLLELYQDQPDLFNELFSNRPPCWSRQKDQCRSVVEHRTTVAYSGNKVGKDYGSAESPSGVGPDAERLSDR